MFDVHHTHHHYHNCDLSEINRKLDVLIAGLKLTPAQQTALNKIFDTATADAKKIDDAQKR